MKPISTYKLRVFGLDVVRAIAILLILCSHSTILLVPKSNTTLVKSIQFFGTIGVDIFFVLSGFLIGTILIKHIEAKQTTLKHFIQFWMRRWFRTLPNYYLVLLINIVLLFVFNNETPKQLYKFVFFFQNFNQEHPDFFTESWSLSIEELAYLVGPILIMISGFVLKKNNKWTFLIVTLLTILFFTLNRYVFHISFTAIPTEISWSKTLRKVVVYRIDSIFYGFIGAFISIYYAQLWKQYRWISFSLGVILFLGVHFYIYQNQLEPNVFSFFFNVWYLALISISILLTFPMFSNWQKGHLFSKTITKISLWSYSIYLINYSIVLLSLKQFINVSILTSIEKVSLLILFWILTFSISALIFKYFEKPILKFRESFKFTKSF